MSFARSPSPYLRRVARVPPRVRARAEGRFYSTETAVANTGPGTRKDAEVRRGDTMASDEDYSAFLDKANEDPNEGVRKTQSSGKVGLKAVDQGVEIPASLKEALKDAFYVSDADEQFEPVGLKIKGKGLPDEGLFPSLGRD